MNLVMRGILPVNILTRNADTLEDDWTDEKVWHRANPFLGITVPIEKVRQACESAKQNPTDRMLLDN